MILTGDHPLTVLNSARNLGILLWGNGIHILQALGLEEDFYAEGEPVEQWTLHDAQGFFVCGV